MNYTTRELQLLAQLLKFSDRYEINIQFWPDQTAVYISKGGVDLIDYGGSFKHSIESALSYLKRINKEKQKQATASTIAIKPNTNASQTNHKLNRNRD